MALGEAVDVPVELITETEVSVDLVAVMMIFPAGA